MTAKKKKRKFLIWTILILSLLVVISLGFFLSQNNKPLEKKEVKVFLVNTLPDANGAYRFFDYEEKKYCINKEHPAVSRLEKEGKIKEWRKLWREKNQSPPDFILHYERADDETKEEDECIFHFHKDNHELKLIECEEKD